MCRLSLEFPFTDFLWLELLTKISPPGFKGDPNVSLNVHRALLRGWFGFGGLGGQGAYVRLIGLDIGVGIVLLFSLDLPALQFSGRLFLFRTPIRLNPHIFSIYSSWCLVSDSIIRCS